MTDEEDNLIEIIHPGMWEAGVDGALPGHQMPAHPVVGPPYRQEYYEGEAEDVGQIIAVDETFEVPGFGIFDHVVVTADTSVLDPDALEHKFCAVGIGKIGSYKLDAVTGANYGGELLTSVIPEPAGATLVLLGGMACLIRRRRR